MNFSFIVMATLAQMIFIFFITLSQSPWIYEDVKYYFIPQCILLILNGYAAYMSNLEILGSARKKVEVTE